MTCELRLLSSRTHDDVIKWKNFPCYWPFVRGIHRSPVNSPHKRQWRGALMFSLIFLNKRLSKQSCGWWLETVSRPLWRHCNEGHGIGKYMTYSLNLVAIKLQMLESLHSPMLCPLMWLRIFMFGSYIAIMSDCSLESHSYLNWTFNN